MLLCRRCSTVIEPRPVPGLEYDKDRGDEEDHKYCNDDDPEDNRKTEPGKETGHDPDEDKDTYQCHDRDCNKDGDDDQPEDIAEPSDLPDMIDDRPEVERLGKKIAPGKPDRRNRQENPYHDLKKIQEQEKAHIRRPAREHRRMEIPGEDSFDKRSIRDRPDHQDRDRPDESHDHQFQAVDTQSSPPVSLRGRGLPPVNPHEVTIHRDSEEYDREDQVHPPAPFLKDSLSCICQGITNNFCIIHGSSVSIPDAGLLSGIRDRLYYSRSRAIRIFHVEDPSGGKAQAIPGSLVPGTCL